MLTCSIKDCVNDAFLESFLNSERVVIRLQDDLIAKYKGSRISMNLSWNHLRRFEILWVTKLYKVFSKLGPNKQVYTLLVEDAIHICHHIACLMTDFEYICEAFET